METEDTEIEFPAQCFSWKWNSRHSDGGLHTPDRSNLEALSGWIGQNPHLTNSGKPVSKAELLRIVLGLGILLSDANLIQFTEEGGYPEETPTYIVESVWETDELDLFVKYVKKVGADLET
jgi:hypothetical protein